MTAPLPPVSGPVGQGDPGEKYAAQDTGQAPDIEAPHQDLSAMAAAAEAAGNAWQSSIGSLLHSPAGYGSGGFQISGDHPAGADGDWNVDMSFPHEGP